MSSDWPLGSLREFADLLAGFAFKSSGYTEDTADVRLLRGDNIAPGKVRWGGVKRWPKDGVAGLSRYVLEPGDVVLAMDRPWIPSGLKVAQISEADAPSYLVQRVARLRATSSEDRNFLFALLSTPDFESYIQNATTGTAVPHISAKQILDYEFHLPPAHVRAQVGAFTAALDDRITLLRETNATLESIAQALFKSWFVDFDPVRAKMEGRTPEGMDEATAALFPDGFESSALGEVPRGWVLKPFGALLAHSIGGDWGSEQPEDKNTVRVAIIRGTDIPDLQSGRDNRVPIRYTSEKKLSTRQLQDGDIVIEVSGGSKGQPTGRALYVTDELLKRFDCPVEPASFCRLFRPIDHSTGVLLIQHLRFIYDQGKTWEYQNQSTGIANFQTTHFLEKELVAVPPDSVLNVFSETVRALMDRMVSSQIDELSQIRDTLLPRLIFGQLQLPEVADAH